VPISRALRAVADDLEKFAGTRYLGHVAQRILDDNGNTVGGWDIYGGGS
jgi:hypothetical protein